METRASWSNLAPMSTIRSHCGAAVIGGKIYVFGGGGPEFKSLQTVEIYDPKADRWTFGPEMPTLRSGVVAVNSNDRAYVMGGGFRRPDGTFNFLTVVEIFDPKTGAWSKGPDLLQRHDAPAAALFNDTIYLFGGHHPEATGGPMTDPAFSFSERLDRKLGEWQEIAPMPTARFSLAAVPFSGKILAMGGAGFREGVFHNYDLIEQYDPAENRWASDPHFRLPWRAAGVGSCVVDGKIFLFGGHSGDRVQDRAAMLDSKTGKWAELPSMPDARVAMATLFLDGRIYLIGGRGPDGRTPTNRVTSLAL
jgi:N-acetylneuraminic acid mutarotase